MNSPGDAFARLQAIAAELPLTDDEARRKELQIEREQLRAAARVAMVGARDEDDVARELDRLRGRLEELAAERIEIPGWQKHARLRRSDPAAATTRINRMIDDANAHEIVSIERRIADIEEALGPDPGDSTS